MSPLERLYNSCYCDWVRKTINRRKQKFSTAETRAVRDFVWEDGAFRAKTQHRHPLRTFLGTELRMLHPNAACGWSADLWFSSARPWHSKVICCHRRCLSPPDTHLISSTPGFLCIPCQPKTEGDVPGPVPSVLVWKGLRTDLHVLERDLNLFGVA